MSSSCDLFIPLERNFATPPEDTNMSHQIKLNTTEQCKKCQVSRLCQALPTVENERTQRQSSPCSCTGSCTGTLCVDASLELNSATTGTLNIRSNKESHVQIYKQRKRKGKHKVPLEDANFDLHAQMNIEPQVSQAGDQKTYYSCLTIDEGFDETKTTRIKVQ